MLHRFQLVDLRDHLEWVNQAYSKVGQGHRRICSPASVGPLRLCTVVLHSLGNLDHVHPRVQVQGCHLDKSDHFCRNSVDHLVLSTIPNSRMMMMRKAHIMISLTARFDATENRSLVKVTAKSSMAMSLEVKVVTTMKTGVMLMSLTTDRGQADSTIVDQRTVVGAGVLHRQGVVGSRQGGAVGRGNVEEVEVVHVIAGVVTVAVVPQELDIEVVVVRVAVGHQEPHIEVVGADLLRDVIVVAVRLQTLGRDKSRHSVEKTCQTKVR